MNAGVKPPFLPYGRQVIEDDDIAAVVATLKGDYLTTGPRVAEFEAALAEATGARHAIACSNGTAALHLAARALGLGAGTTTIVPAITFLASANAIRLHGGDVVFADVDPDTGLMRPQDLTDALARCPGGRADAVVNVHLTGQCGDIAGIQRVAKSAGMRVIDDACHALGTNVRINDVTHRIGGNDYADLTCFSFHPVKTIAMGEGGAVTTSDPDLAKFIARDRSHGMSRDPQSFTQAEDALDGNGEVNPWYYEMAEPGLNYRVPDVLCALGISQLTKLGRFVTRRRALVASYDALLKQLAPHVTPLHRTPNVDPAWHLYVALIDFDALGLSRADVMRRLAAQGIGTQVHYFPVHRQPYYKAMNPNLMLPGAEAYYRRCLTLPLYPSMSTDDVTRVVCALKRAIRG
ncbi:MAG: UDP-4-amino-4,6-dideoxy-N-acetyl-beta-L-altrosamine transaminase [Alphaproteobacteria bacterium]|nr:UDP-4-amino-4,6-dideoxy-N-acetyl-beta-L-altrosamine transaminase [Alphaproteobacteria bacterium]